MKAKLLFVAALLAFTPPAHSTTGQPAAETVKPLADAKRYPLRGVIVEVQIDAFALLVKHEAIPGLMPAMTMLFKVDVVTLTAAVKGQRITATLVQREDGFWLENVKPAQNRVVRPTRTVSGDPGEILVLLSAFR